MNKQLESVSVERYIVYFVKFYFKSTSPFTMLFFLLFLHQIIRKKTFREIFFQILLPRKGGLVFSFNFFIIFFI